MRTTIQIDDELLAQVRQLAVRTGRSVNALVQDALRQMLARQHQAAVRPPIRLPTASGDGLLPGVDLDESAGLLDLMESSGNQ